MEFEPILLCARSNGTSMISLIIPPRDQISRVSRMLADEFGTASNIKSRVNRQSVLGAITSVQQRLKLYSKGTHVDIIQLSSWNVTTISCADMANSSPDYLSSVQLCTPVAQVADRQHLFVRPAAAYQSVNQTIL